ncbi:hypothetical protein [Thermoplasma volcanium GSS1]|uniref:Dinitrogenase iron-molybdenum cofactor biosynthesis domain-containing protein n=1 Tax=Thermoplasma volcanium (strain ATCC 51530 / DSM 4299 / JCM 9571 / NBRC 15438 / GSS1) TaxID=273116 RepID=Q97BA3_THEVO|nr:NifB/NifX family molybdenum-iron cluster-binding protein [Thermoplasma volcanium]BAB59696.1 hypothetical protein [Thermoplasma volcanium GSS1]
MKIAVAVSDNKVGGPGESQYVYIYDVKDGNADLLEKYENPAMHAYRAKGLQMLASAISRGVDAIILSELGRPGYSYLKDRIKVYITPEVEVERAIKDVINGRIPVATAPTHEHGMHEHQ